MTAFLRETWYVWTYSISSTTPFEEAMRTGVTSENFPHFHASLAPAVIVLTLHRSKNATITNEKMSLRYREECPCRPAESRPRLTRRRGAGSALALVYLLGLAPSARGFMPGTVLHQRQRSSTTKRFFRNLLQDDQHVDSVMSVAAPFLSTSSPFYHHRREMPAWLSQPLSHKYKENISKLKEAMTNSFFTEKERKIILSAIEQAAQGDRNKIAGAADFLMILVETMEMGTNALVAAAFHYCSCVSARERSLLLPPGTTFSFSEFVNQRSDVISYGSHVVDIAKDAARLKELEMVAARVIQNKNSARVSPDSRDAENLIKLLSTENKDWRALAIRCAASLYRLRGIEDAGQEKLTPETVRASREALYIYAPLASRLGMHRLKNELEDSAFRLLYRRQYKTVSSLALQSRRGSSRGFVSLTGDNESVVTIGQSMKEVLDGVTREVRDMLREDPDFSALAENVSVTARVKEPYSMWRKMLRNHNDHILQVPDALALRIVFDAKKTSPFEDAESVRARERALCYYAQNLCTERWHPADDPRFKDYVKDPKPNGYQSLHYTANTEWGGQDWSLEIQVRSGEMHKVAEYGVASHWDYKAKGKRKSSVTSSETPVNKDAYLWSVQKWRAKPTPLVSLRANPDRDPGSSETSSLVYCDSEVECRIRADRIRARTARLAPYIKAFEKAQSDLVRDHVFVFVSQASSSSLDGKVLALPAGASVIDALRECERKLGFKIGDSETGVLHNGEKAMSATQKLNNGDVLMVPVHHEQTAEAVM